MEINFRPRPRQIELPAEQRRPLIPPELSDSRIFQGWGPRVLQTGRR